MRQHANLPAMMCLVSDHVAQHLHAHRPRRSPSISAKSLDAPPIITKRLTQHLPAPSSALGQSRTSPLRRTARTVKLHRNLQMRSRKPHPLTADVMHMRKDRRNRANPAWRLCSPSPSVETFDEHLVHAIVRRKDLYRRSAESSVNLMWTHGHVSTTPSDSSPDPAPKIPKHRR
jgi:hypothetical protein